MSLESTPLVERFSPDITGNMELEHKHRYILAREFVHHQRVLDLACGEGYGSHFLAQAAAQVIGVDIDSDTILQAQHKYRDPRLEFRVGTCSNVPLPSASIDVVVSFETIEHHDEHEEMMAEIKRVLRPNGLLILSCPDKHEYTDVRGTINPFHVKELYREEFERLISSHFKHTHFLGQRVVYGSLLSSVSRNENSFCTYHDDSTQIQKIQGVRRPEYLFVIASDGELPSIPHTFYDGSTEFGQEHLINERRDKDVHIRNLTAMLAHKEVHIEHLTAGFDEIYASRSWRITAPLRKIISLFRQLLA